MSNNDVIIDINLTDVLVKDELISIPHTFVFLIYEL